MTEADLTVLLVEDEAADALLFERAFRQAGMKSRLVRLKNGDEAVSYLEGTAPYEDRQAHPLPSVMFLDIKMPRRSGFEVIQWVRQQPNAIRRLPILMLTSSRHQVDVDLAYELGANAYMAKPDTATELKGLVLIFKDYWTHCELPRTLPD